MPRTNDLAVAIGRAHAKAQIAERTGFRIARLMCRELNVRSTEDFLLVYATERQKSLSRGRAKRRRQH